MEWKLSFPLAGYPVVVLLCSFLMYVYKAEFHCN